MDHPNIAKVLDAGATETGRPYFVMELVKGVRITDYCDRNNLATTDRLGLFIQVCHAIQHAHQKGIIHRDIKPSNILVTLHDGVPVPKVIDFGIAKSTTNLRLTDKTVYTAIEQFIGTPAYMSPEQAELSGLDIDTRSDIYALGVLLYELLTGQTPFDAKRLIAAGLDEIRRIIREEEPPRPSTRISILTAAEQTAIAKRRHSEPLKLLGIIRGDLDWIAMKTLEKDRTRRYESSSGLAADIQRYLSSEPVVARPPSQLYRFQKLVRRNKLAFTAAAAVSLSLVLGLGIATFLFFREQAARQRADAATGEAVQNKQEVERKKEEIERKNTEYRAMLVEAANSDRATAEGNLGLGRQPAAFAYLARACEYDPPSTLAAEKAIAALNAWPYHLPTVILAGHSSMVHTAQFSPDGTRIVTASEDKTARVWDVATGKALATLAGHEAGVWSAQFSPDGTRIVTSGKNSQRT